MTYATDDLRDRLPMRWMTYARKDTLTTTSTADDSFFGIGTCTRQDVRQRLATGPCDLGG